MTDIALIQQREIEARLAKVLIDRYAEVLGPDEAAALAGDAIRRQAEAAGREMARQIGGRSMEDLARVVREVWAREDALQIVFKEISSNHLAFDVNRCRYAELYERLGIRHLGAHLSCGRDAAFARGFNPAIHMERTQTIMEGAPSCDFRFTLSGGS